MCRPQSPPRPWAHLAAKGTSHTWPNSGRPSPGILRYKAHTHRAAPILLASSNSGRQRRPRAL
uniref:Uncharacterized protein n=1 Tax=Arundo donax TaxID=35708 RepID=A0A0A9C7G7_ARUDO